MVEELNWAYAVVKRYTYGLDLISYTDVSAGNTYYYGYDGTGSTRMLMNETGEIVAEYVYDAFGTLIYTLNLEPEILSNAYLFHGEQYDSDLGLYYLRARYMHPNTGRFWSMDEYEGNMEETVTINKYVVFGNNPVNNIDPGGNLFEIKVGSEIKWGERVSELLRHGVLLNTPILWADSVIEKNLDIGKEVGMGGKQILSWTESNMALNDTVNGVKWIREPKGWRKYESPTAEGVFCLEPSPEGAKYPIAIDSPYEQTLRFHAGFKSQGCIVYGYKNIYNKKKSVGAKIEDRIKNLFKQNISIITIHKVKDNRTYKEKILRPYPPKRYD